MSLYLKRWCSHFAVQPDGSIRTISDEQFLIETGRAPSVADNAWRETPDAKSLLGIIGAYGCATKVIEDEEHFVQILRQAFGLKGEDVATLAREMQGIPRSYRGAAVRKAVRLIWRTDFNLWPATAAARNSGY